MVVIKGMFAKRPHLLLLGICANFLLLTGVGLESFFTPDDSMNLYLAWVEPLPALIAKCILFWKGAVRPFGQLFYRLMYGVFGWRPFPFRVACLALLLLNIYLVWLLLRRLPGSPRFAFLATLAASFHGAMWSIYVTTGTVYDILSQTFFLSGFVLYVSLRDRFSRPPWYLSVGICLATLLAFESKEMGFMLPFELLAFEVCFRFDELRSGRVQWLLFGVFPPALLALAGLVGIWSNGADAVFSSTAYGPVFSWLRFRETIRIHWIFLTFKLAPISLAQGVRLAGFSLLTAVLMRSRVMLFGWIFFFTALLPLSFVTPRADGYVLYVPYTGAAIYVSSLALRLIDLCTDRAALRTALLSGVCGAVLWAQWKESARVGQAGFGPGGESIVRELTDFAEPHCRVWRDGDRFVAVDAPFGDDWQGTFVFNLACHTRDLKVEGVRSAEFGRRAPAAGERIIVYQSGEYRMAAANGTTTKP